MQLKIENSKLFIDNKEFHVENIKFIKEKGVGANGHVFLATNTLINRYEAIKIWLPKKHQNKVDVNRFKAEIQKNAIFQNKYIATIYDANQLNGIYYCRMQYISGTTLGDYLMQKSLSYLDIII